MSTPAHPADSAVDYHTCLALVRLAAISMLQTAIRLSSSASAPSGAVASGLPGALSPAPGLKAARGRYWRQITRGVAAVLWLCLIDEWANLHTMRRIGTQP